MASELKVGATNVVKLSELQDMLTTDFPPSGDVVAAATLFDSGNNAVPGTVALPVTLFSGVGSKALYTATIPHTVNLVKGSRYELRGTVTVNGVIVGKAEEECVAV